MKLKYLKEDYIPKGQLEGFPLEIVDKMLERRFEQKGGIFDFEEDHYQGFDWDRTIEGVDFWVEVLIRENFNLFFERYPKEELVEEASLQKELPLPRVIEVKFSDEDRWKKEL